MYLWFNYKCFLAKIVDMKKILLMLCTFSLFISCMTGLDKDIDNAAYAIENDDYETAQLICDRVMAYDWENLSLENKCDLAICYLALYGEIDDDSNLDSMIKCYESAMDESPKETRKYLKSIDEDVYDGINLIIQLNEIAGDWEVAY